MSALFSGPLAQAIGWALLHLLWQGVLVAAILAASLALLQRQSANARYLASCGALIVLVALSVMTAYRAYDPIREPVPASTAAFANINLSDLSTTAPSAAPSGVSTNAMDLVASYAGSHMPQILIVWLFGVTLLSIRLAVGWVGAHRLAARHARTAEIEWQRALARIAGALDLHRSVRLLESAAVEVPTVIGWLRPVVLLPVASLSGLSADQIEMILAHELAHIRRHDFIVNLMQSTIETLFFYQPAVWWISRRIRIEREHCCDDLAVAVSGDPIRYARALTRFEELRIDAAQTVIAASGGSLITRVRRLVGVHAESANWSSRWAAGASLLVVLVALMVGPALPMFAKHEDKEKEKANPKVEAKADKHAEKYAAKSKSEVDVEAPSAKDDDEEDMDSEDAEADVDVDVQPAPMAVPNPVAMPEGTPAPTPAIAVVAPGVRIDVAEIAARAVERVRPAIAPRAIAYAAGVASIAIDGDHKIVDEKKLTVDDLIALRSAGVTPRYIEEMRGMGLGSLSLNDIVAMRIQGVSPEYVRGLRAAGIEVTNVESVISMRIQGVTGEYIQGMRAAGYDKLSAKDLIAMRIQGVTPRYVQEMANAGYRNLTPRELVELRIQGVSGDFVKSLAEAGYTNLTVRDLVRLAASGVNADFIRELAKYRSKQ
jgi:beta-lactamase regulating signal transducer with metallopeptidase domain